ncbi:pyridoxamine 5'-phosphate oxidase family protein [Streptomyces sp. MS1.AVA.3]|uniref:pyridoxamine 5'-phosphate oxidase family protein n=1 Tax=Streptomyces decoyicus TaxID=249567 RepID=UPI0030C154B9
MPLSQPEREAFLTQPHIGALAVARANPGRAPLVVPIWYCYEPGREVWIMTGRDSVKAKAITAAGRVSLLVERIEPTVRYVSVEGAVVSAEPSTAGELWELSSRYLPTEKVPEYVKAAENYGPQVTIRFRTEHWLSADLGEV